jgi:drug/metabolite transporter (DMT)-like permease
MKNTQNNSTINPAASLDPDGGRQALLSRLAMAFVATAWGMAYVAVKYLLTHGWSQTQVAYIRIVLPGLVLIPVAVMTLRAHWGKPELKLLPQMAMLGFWGFGVSHFTVVWGQQYTTAAVAGLLSVASPLTALILAAILKIDRFSWSKAAGALLSTCGVVIVVLLGRGPAEVSARNLVGPLLIILGFALVGVYNNAIRPLQKSFTPLEVSAITAVSPALLALWPASRVFGATEWALLEPGSLAAILWLGLIAGGLAIFSVGYAVNKIGPTSAASFLYLNPVVSILGGYLLLGEQITLWLLFGASLILGGLSLANKRH